MAPMTQIKTRNISIFAFEVVSCFKAGFPSFFLSFLSFLSLFFFQHRVVSEEVLVGPRSQEAGEEGDCTYRYTVTSRMTPAFRRAAMRTILVFLLTVKDNVTIYSDSVHRS